MSQYRIKPGRQRPYKPISARMINTMADLANDQRVVAGPGVSSFGWPGGTVIQADSAATNFGFAYSPSAGIAAATGVPPADITPGVASCTAYRWNGSKLVNFGTQSVPVYNPWPIAVGGGHLLAIVYRWGTWWVIAEACSTSTAPAKSFSTDFSSDFLAATAAEMPPSGTDFTPDFGSDFGMSTAGRELLSISIGGGTPTSGIVSYTPPGHLGGGGLVSFYYNWTARSVQSAFEAIFGVGNILCWGGPLPSATVYVLFIGDFDRADVQPLSLASSTLDAGTPTLTVVQNGTGTGNETQVVYPSVAATAGTFILNLAGNGSSGSIPYNCTSTQMQTALNSWLGTGTTKVWSTVGNLTSVPIPVTFIGALGGQNLSQMTVGPVSGDFDGTYAVGTAANGVP